MTRRTVPVIPPGTTPPVLSSDALTSGGGRGGFRPPMPAIELSDAVMRALMPLPTPGPLRKFANDGAAIPLGALTMFAVVGVCMWHNPAAWVLFGVLAAAFIFTVTVWCVDDRETDRDAYLYAAAVTGAVGAVALVAAVVGVLVGRVA